MASRWTAKQLEYLERNYKDNDIDDLVKKINKTVHAIRWKAAKLGLLIRDGKHRGYTVKKTVNFAEEHAKFLSENKHRQSDILYEALEAFIKKEKKLVRR
jgi:hypothetical protein